MSADIQTTQDPKSLAEWQGAIDAAAMLLVLDAATSLGMVNQGMVSVDVGRCRDLLRQGEELGVTPRQVLPANAVLLHVVGRPLDLIQMNQHTVRVTVTLERASLRSAPFYRYSVYAGKDRQGCITTAKDGVYVQMEETERDVGWRLDPARLFSEVLSALGTT